MGWQIELVKALSKGAQAGSKAASGASKAVSKVPGMWARFSTWFRSVSWTPWIKAGAAGGTGLIIWNGWRSVVSSVADATGLSEGDAQSLMFLVVGIFAAWLLARLLIPSNAGGSTIIMTGRAGSSTASNRQSANRSSAGRNNGRARSGSTGRSSQKASSKRGKAR